MKVIVCGAGQVGSNIARYLSNEGSDVTIIDCQADLVEKVTDSLDVPAWLASPRIPRCWKRRARATPT
jgi:trk system potassium uptake protein TrkA